MRRLNTCTRCILRTSSSLMRVCRAKFESFDGVVVIGRGRGARSRRFYPFAVFWQSHYRYALYNTTFITKQRTTPSSTTIRYEIISLLKSETPLEHRVQLDIFDAYMLYIVYLPWSTRSKRQQFMYLPYGNTGGVLLKDLSWWRNLLCSHSAEVCYLRNRDTRTSHYLCML